MSKRILIVDDDAIVLKTLFDLLSGHGYQAEIAATPEDAVRTAALRPPDLVLLDVNLSSKVDGPSLCARMRSIPKMAKTPVIMLTGDSSKATVVRSIRSGANDYMLKTGFQAETLITRIEKWLAPSAVPAEATPAPSETLAPAAAPTEPTPPASALKTPAKQAPLESEHDADALSAPVTTEAVHQRVRAGRVTMAISPVVSEVLTLCARPGTAFTEIAKAIGQDPALAARVLSCANSAYYGATEWVDSLPRAVVTMGNTNVRQAVLALTLTKDRGRKEGSVLDRRTVWMHSLFAATVARSIARHVGVSEDEAFLAGLMHDLGLVVLDDYYGKQLAEAVHRAQGKGEMLQVAEEAVLGIDHAEVGRAASETWHLPPHLRAVLALHHLPWAKVKDGEGLDRRLLAVARISDMVARAAGQVAVCDRLAPCGDEAVYLGLGRDVIDGAHADALKRFDDLCLTYLAEGGTLPEWREKAAEPRTYAVIDEGADREDPIALVLASVEGYTVHRARGPEEVGTEVHGVVLSARAAQVAARVAPWQETAPIAQARWKACVLPPEAGDQLRKALSRPGWTVLQWPVSRERLLSAMGKGEAQGSPAP